MGGRRSIAIAGIGLFAAFFGCAAYNAELEQIAPASTPALGTAMVANEDSGSDAERPPAVSSSSGTIVDDAGTVTPLVDGSMCAFRHNDTLPADVTGDGFVSPLDALNIVNALGRLRDGASLQQVCVDNLTRMLDANNDGMLTSADYDLVVAVLNAR